MKAARISSMSTADPLRRRGTWCVLAAMFAAQLSAAADVVSAGQDVAQIIGRIGADTRPPRPPFVGCWPGGCERRAEWKFRPTRPAYSRLVAGAARLRGSVPLRELDGDAFRAL